MTDSYIGVPPQSGFITTAKQRVTSSTNNYIDLDHAISSLADVIIWVNSIKQDSTNLSLTSSNRITLGGTLVSSDVCEVAFLGKSVATQSPPVGGVTNDMLAGSIANSKLANSSITLNGSAVSLGGSATVGGDNDPMVSAKFTGSQSISASTQTIVTCFTSESYDYDSTWNGSKFTVPAGITNQPFFMSASVRVGSLDDGSRLELSFFVNGTEALNTRTMASGNSATMGTDATFSQQLSTNDYVEIKVFHNSSGSKSMSGGFFHVHKLIKG